MQWYKVHRSDSIDNDMNAVCTGLSMPAIHSYAITTKNVQLASLCVTKSRNVIDRLCAASIQSF